jgi:hypothetical protein
VSLEQTSVCVVDEAGAVVLERRAATEPEMRRASELAPASAEGSE